MKDEPAYEVSCSHKKDGWCAECLQHLLDELDRLKKWIADLQSGQFVNCVYCGHRYGPNESTPVAMADILTEHINQCPKHPLSATRSVLRNIVGYKKLHTSLLNANWHQIACEIADMAENCLRREEQNERPFKNS